MLPFLAEQCMPSTSERDFLPMDFREAALQNCQFISMSVTAIAQGKESRMLLYQCSRSARRFSMSKTDLANCPQELHFARSRVASLPWLTSVAKVATLPTCASLLQIRAIPRAMQIMATPMPGREPSQMPCSGKKAMLTMQAAQAMTMRTTKIITMEFIKVLRIAHPSKKPEKCDCSPWVKFSYPYCIIFFYPKKQAFANEKFI